MSGLFENGFTPVHAMILASMFLAFVVVELGYMVFSPGNGAKKRINRRMKVSDGKDKISQKGILLQLRKERGLDENGKMVLPILWLNRLIVQSGLSIGLGRFFLYYLGYVVVCALGILLFTQSIIITAILMPLFGFALPMMWLNMRRKKKINLFAQQLPDAIDLMTRSLKAGHPIPVAISMVAREMPDPIGTEFGMVSDEVTYGSDLVTALNSLFERVGVTDLPLLISSVSIQSTTGGNLREILEGLSQVVRDRMKMKRKIKAISAEGRMSAMFLTAMPIILFGVLLLLMPDYYDGIWQEPMTWKLLSGLGVWLVLGNAMIFKMVSFKF